MNKAQLIQRVARESRLKKSQATRAVKGLVRTIREALKLGDKISLSGLGTFKIKPRKARKGRNPKTGETIQIPAGRKISFKPSFSLKRLIKSQP
ncbi:MAG: HU family DNA-binding protein [Elusimicrobia bacterium]|nr:HU family DNA-binding protein [Elusimicrobiota bacterium]